MPTNLAAQPAKQLNRRLYHWRQNWPLSGSARMSVRKAQATEYTEDMRKASSHQSARDRETERAPADRTPRAGSSASNRPSRRGMSGGRASQSPELLRRLLRAKDRMDAASHEDWPVRRLARVSGVSEAHFARSFKRGLRRPAAPLPAHATHRAGDGAAPRHRPVHHRDRVQTGLGEPGHLRAHLPRRHRPDPGRHPRARQGRGARASTACPTASSAPRTAPTSRSQFRRSGAGSRAI